MLIARHEIHRPRPHPGTGLGAAPEVKLVAARGEADGWLACAACKGFVAESRARIGVNGAHSHSFLNPAGVIFRVTCFAEAPGVLAVGEESGYFTWFAGFAWRVAVCGACAEHLGWSYRRADSSFVALIEDRVVEQRSPSGTSGRV